MGRTIHGQRTKGSTTKLTHNCCIFGIMGGTAPLTGKPLAHRAYLEKRASRKALCIQDCAQGHQYLKDHQILGCNPQAGGVGNMWRHRHYSHRWGPTPPAVTSDTSSCNNVIVVSGAPRIDGVDINGNYCYDSGDGKQIWNGKKGNLRISFSAGAGNWITINGSGNGGTRKTNENAYWYFQDPNCINDPQSCKDKTLNELFPCSSSQKLTLKGHICPHPRSWPLCPNEPQDVTITCANGYNIY